MRYVLLFWQLHSPMTVYHMLSESGPIYTTDKDAQLRFYNVYCPVDANQVVLRLGNSICLSFTQCGNIRSPSKMSSVFERKEFARHGIKFCFKTLFRKK